MSDIHDTSERCYLKEEKNEHDINDFNEWVAYKFGTNEQIKENNDLSNQSFRKMKYAIKTLYQISETKKNYIDSKEKYYYWKLNFITLSLSSTQGIYDDYCVKYKLLNHFLTNARKKGLIKSYVWKAEPQGNGNIHFHITSNQFYHHQQIRDDWNNCQRKFGYINDFYGKFGYVEVNSTDVHSVRAIRYLDAYLLKYLKKNDEERRKLAGRKFGCSHNLSYNHRCQFIADDKDYKLFNFYYGHPSVKTFNHDFFSCFFSNNQDMYKSFNDIWKNKYINHLNVVKNNML